MKQLPHLAIALPVLFAFPAIQAATFTYSGVSGVENWSDGASWDVNPVSASDTILFYQGSLGDGAVVGSVNDVADPFQLNRLDFAYTSLGSGTAAEVTISGGQLNFVNDGSNSPILDLSPAGGNPTPNLTISNSLLLSDDLTINTRNNLTILSGQISGTGGINVTDNQNTSSGNVWITVFSNTSNNYNGDTGIGAMGTSGGERRLQLGASEVIPHGAGFGNVVFSTNNSGGRVARLQLNGFNETINGLVAPVSAGGNADADFGQSVMNGNANAANLTLGANDATANFVGGLLDGAGGGSLSLTKIGAGTQTLAGRSTHTGATTVNGGGLVIDYDQFGSSMTSDPANYFSANSDLTLGGGANFGINGRSNGGNVNESGTSLGRYSTTISVPNAVAEQLAVGQELVISDIVSGDGTPATGVFVVSKSDPGATTTDIYINKRPVSGGSAFSVGTISATATEATTTQDVQSLTFSGANGENATIDFGDSNNVSLLINSSPIQLNDGSTVTLANWSGSFSGSGADQWLFSGAPSEFSSVFDQSEIIFQGFGAGYNLIDFGGTYEVVPVPEPAAYALLMACGTLLLAIRRRQT